MVIQNMLISLNCIVSNYKCLLVNTYWHFQYNLSCIVPLGLKDIRQINTSDKAHRVFLYSYVEND